MMRTSSKPAHGRLKRHDRSHSDAPAFSSRTRIVEAGELACVPLGAQSQRQESAHSMVDLAKDHLTTGVPRSLASAGITRADFETIKREKHALDSSVSCICIGGDLVCAMGAESRRSFFNFLRY